MKEIEIKSPKQAFLDEMQKALSDSLPAKWSDDQKKKSIARTTGSKIKSGAFTAIPMICRANQCPFKETCEFFKEGEAPIGEACPYEMGMVVTFMADYVDQLDVDPENWVELSQIRDLVDQEVQMIRKAKYLAQEDFIQENVIGVDSDGDPIFQKSLHTAVELEDRLHKRRAQMFKQILASRESKVKAGAMQIDSAQGMANLVSKLRAVDRERDEAMRRKLGIVDVDDYIEEDKSEDKE